MTEQTNGSRFYCRIGLHKWTPWETEKLKLTRDNRWVGHIFNAERTCTVCAKHKFKTHTHYF